MAAKKYLDLDGLAYFWGKITNYIGENHEILMGTTAGWNAQPTLISSKDTIYVYTDYDTDESGNDVPNIKIGDGLAYLIDLPFINAIEMEHINNSDIHVTAADKARWDAKVRCYYSDLENELLVFTTH